MSYAFGHLIFSWLVGKSAERFSQKIRMSHLAWFLLLFGAIIPDGDYFIQWFWKEGIHRTFTHSIFSVILGFIFIYIVLSFFNKNGIKFLGTEKYNVLFLASMFALGILTHLVADMILGWPGVPLLWPFGTNFYFFGLENNFSSLAFSELPFETLLSRYKFALLDMALGVLWIGYLLFKNKIKEF